MEKINSFTQFRTTVLTLFCTIMITSCLEVRYLEPEEKSNTEDSMVSENTVIKLSDKDLYNALKTATDDQIDNPPSDGMAVPASAFYSKTTNQQECAPWKKSQYGASEPKLREWAMDNTQSRQDCDGHKKELRLHVNYEDKTERQAREGYTVESLISNAEAEDNLKDLVYHENVTAHNPFFHWQQFIVDRIRDWLPDPDKDTAETIKPPAEQNTPEASDEDTATVDSSIDNNTNDKNNETTTIKDLTKPSETNNATINDINANPLFPIQHYCNNSILLLAQSTALNQLEMTCNLLEKIALLFHDTMQTNYQVVDDDYNDLIKIHIFSSYASYIRDIKQASGLDFAASGGFFYEGNPAQPDNNANIYVFKKTYSNAIWNLEHEYVHHLNARYIKYGPVKNTAYYLFWEEGIAEYFSRSNVQKAVGFSIRDVLDVNANSSHTQTYTWSYWFIRFLIEEKPTLFFQLSEHLKINNSKDYKDILDYIEYTHNDEFTLWLSKQ